MGLHKALTRLSALLTLMAAPALVYAADIVANNETYAKSHPDQYNSWTQTKQSTDRASALKEDPNLVVLWAGYPFSKDYNKPRGHFYAVTDVRETLRTAAPKTADDGPLPMACWSCKSPDVARVIASEGEDAYFTGKWARGGPFIVNPIGCADCHDTNSADFMANKLNKPALTLSRPYVERAMNAIGKPFDKSDRLMKQSQVCGQCHSEYHFAAPNAAVKFPWDKGYDTLSMEKYYEDPNLAFKADWVHGISKAPMLKAQHPEYETWLDGVHGKNNVSCADCHMPKVKNAKGETYTSHNIGNPFDQFEQTCATCHEQDKAFLQDVVASRKKTVNDLKLRVENQLVRAHFEAGAAWKAGATEAEMKPALNDIRLGQWRWDMAIASHGIHMHSPDVGLHLLGTAMEKASEARAKLARVLASKGVVQEVAIPDISTVEKAQAAVGWDMNKLRADKDDFLKTIVPQWDKQAKQNGLIN